MNTNEKLVLSDKVLDRFWSRVEKTDSCWIWKAGTDKDGYGKFCYDYTYVRAHRISWQLIHGVITPDILVLHNCPGGDNPACVNDLHLFTGTQDDNRKDCAAKGRSARGEMVPTSKLVADQVIEIRRRFASGESYKSQLARDFQVDNTLITKIIDRRLWKHVP